MCACEPCVLLGWPHALATHAACHVVCRAHLLRVLNGLEVDQLALAVAAHVVIEGEVAPALGSHAEVGHAARHQAARLLKALHRCRNDSGGAGCVVSRGVDAMHVLAG